MELFNSEGLSVVICCYQSAGRIAETLYAVLCALPADNVEIILVDNNCVDDTVSIARSILKASKIPFVIRHESKPGLQAARAMGVRSARFNIVAFVDDDNSPQMQYFSNAIALLRSDATLGAIGGRGIAIAADGMPLPDWFSAVEKSFACGPQAKREGFASSLYGACLVVRREPIAIFFGELGCSVSGDRDGENLNSGGDSELCYWLIFNGYRLWYDPEMIFFHRIDRQRLSIEYYLRLVYGLGHSAAYDDIYREITGTKKDRGFYLRSSRLGLAVWIALKVLQNFRESLHLKNSDTT